MNLPKWGKPSKRQIIHAFKYCLSILGGNAIAAAAAAFFIIPHGLVMGGTTGIGIFIQHFWNNEFAVSIVVYIANIAFFLIGLIFLGKKFAAATLAGTLLYPSFISLWTFLNNLYIDANGGLPIGGNDKMLAALIGAILFGVGLAIVVRVGASTGGTDIPPLIFHKYFGLPVSVGFWVIDIVIILMQLVVNSLDVILYALLVSLIASVVIDLVSPIGLKRTQVKIISKKYREIREMILNDLKRGVTVLYGQTGYLKENCKVILTIVGNRELAKLKNEVQRIDPEAFMTISVVSEVRGRGFTSEGIYLPKDQEVKDDLEEIESVPPPGEQKG